MNKLIPAVALIVVLIGGGIAWAGYKTVSKNDIPGRAQAGDFFGQQGGEAGGRQAGNGRMMRNGNFGGASGNIIAKDETTITLQPENGGSQIVFYSEATKIAKTVEIQISDLTVGQMIMAQGVKNEDSTVTAQTLQVRQAMQVAGDRMRDEAGDGTKTRQRAGQRDGAPDGMSNGGRRPDDGHVSGQIAAIDGNKITVKSFNDTQITVVLASDAKIFKMAEGSSDELKEGVRISVMGSKNNDGSIAAQTINIGELMAGFGVRRPM